MFIEKTPCLVYDLLVLIDFIFNKLPARPLCAVHKYSQQVSSYKFVDSCWWWLVLVMESKACLSLSLAGTVEM